MKRLYFLFVIAGVLSSCSSNEAAHSGSFHSVKPLRITMTAPKELLTINSIGVLPPSLPRSTQCSLADLEEMILRALRSELQVDLVSGEKLERGSTDGLLEVEILSCSERIGSAAGASQPAAVAFTATLTRVKDQQEIWKAEFVREERAFTSDVFGGKEVVHKGTGFRSAREILHSGIYDAARDLATRRDEQFYLGSLVPPEG